MGTHLVYPGYFHQHPDLVSSIGEQFAKPLMYSLNLSLQQFHHIKHRDQKKTVMLGEKTLYRFE